MALPVGITYVTVTGQVLDVPPGASRGVVFHCPWWLIGTTDDQICPPFTIGATLDSDGAFSVQLPATDDPAWQPQGGQEFTYRVNIASGARHLAGSLAVPFDGGPIDLADALNPDDASQAGQAYLLASSRSAPGGVAALDADGDVTDAEGNKITGGGGGGSTAWADITGKPSTFAPSAHAASHGSAGGDAVSLNASQITAGTLNIGRVPTGTSGTTVALGDAPAGAISTHVGQSDPHGQYALEADVASSLAGKANTAHTHMVSQVTGYPDVLDSGEAAMRRDQGMGGVGIEDGAMHLTYFTATKTETIAAVITAVVETAAANNTVARIGIYSVGADGALTGLLASTANLTSLWGSTYQNVTRALQASFNKVAGTRYAIGFLRVGGTGPALAGLFPSASIGRLNPRMNGIVFGLSDLPASVVAGSVNEDYRMLQAVLIP